MIINKILISQSNQSVPSVPSARCHQFHRSHRSHWLHQPTTTQVKPNCNLNLSSQTGPIDFKTWSQVESVRFGPTWSQSQTGPIKSQVKPNQTKSTWSLKSNRTGRTDRSHRSHRPTVGQFDLESGHFDLKSDQINPESGQFDLKVVILTWKWSIWPPKWYFRSRDITQISKKEILFFTKIKIWVTQNFQKRKF